MNEKINTNYVSDILDEIALEGLDGITIEALWKRLSVRQEFCIRIDDCSKYFVWDIIIRMNDVKFYQLPEPRPPLQYYDFSIASDNQNAVIELDELYPYCAVRNVPGVLGSCKDFFTRVDVTSEVIQMHLHDVEAKWDNTLVLVASQDSRNFSLLGNYSIPSVDFFKCPLQYEVLERVGRCRQVGLATCGKGSIQSVINDSKSVFHYLKLLYYNKLVKRQPLFGSLHPNPNASKIHLPRFHGIIINENMYILQTAIEELKTRPNYLMPCDEFYALFDPKCKGKIKKYKKTAIFRKYIGLTKNLPYRKFFPNATPSEWERKSKSGERIVRCFQLLNPELDLGETVEKDCDVDEDDSSTGFIPRGIYYKNMSIVAQAYHHLKHSGSLGLTNFELSDKMGVNRRLTRGLLKRLTSDKFCKSYIENDGRRRSKRFIVGENTQAKEAASEIAQILSEPVTKESVKKEKKVEKSPVSSVEKLNLTQLQDENVSYRTLRRIALIIKTIKTNRFRLFHQISKYINEEEAKEGITSKVDRLTIRRVLENLEKDGVIKVIVLNGKDIDSPVVRLYADPTFEPDEKLKETLYHTHLSFKEQVKVLEEGQVILDVDSSNILSENLIEAQKLMRGIKKMSVEDSPECGENKIVYSPKFIRLNIIHDLIFHLVYEYTGITDKSQEEMIKELSKTAVIDEDVKEEMPRLYTTHVSPHMFVSPLKPIGNTLGWFLISDLLVRMPLSIMCKIVRVKRTSTELLRYLHHPIRKHFLVKDLPLSIRQAFFDRKNDLASFYYDLRRLCFLGLVQFGTKFGREYFQTSMYLNRKASLLDTTSSPPEYYQVPSNMNFDVKNYCFISKSDVKKYWMDMYNICMATNLGVKTNVIGKEILTERESSKECLKKAAEPKSVEKVLQDDDGRIPGDNLGAAGLDSVMFSFLRSNWTGSINKSKEFGKEKQMIKMPLQKLKKEQGIKGKLIIKNRRRKIAPKTNNIDLLERQEAAKPSKVRKIKEREFKFERQKKITYDEVDLKALKLMNTLRVTWSTAEDNLLLICRVAMMYLCPNNRTFVRIPWVEVRKVLQENLPESRNKTQRAIARRIVYMLKNQATLRSVNMCLEELKELPETKEKFDCTDLLSSIKPSSPNVVELQNQLYEKFHELVWFLKDRFINSSKLALRKDDEDLIPDTLEEFLEKFQQESSDENLTDVRSIRENIIRAVLMSSLSCRADKTSSAVQLFDIYRQYDDDELQNAVKELHADKVITISRKAGSPIIKSGKILPLSFTPYKLSFAFQHMLNVKYTHSIYPESFAQLNNLLQQKDEEEFEVDLNECNVALYLLACKDMISFRTILPDQIIALDSGDLTDATYSKMLERYCQILRLNSVNPNVFCLPKKVIIKTGDEDGGEIRGNKRKRSTKSDGVKAKKKNAGVDNVEEESEATNQDEKDDSGENETPVIEKNELFCDKTRSSRVILYIMREKAKDSAENESHKSNPETCVVNASRILICCQKDQLELYSKSMEPKIVSRIVKNIISRSSLPVNLVEEESVIENFKSEEESNLAKNILKFISFKQELGATNRDLRTNFGEDKALARVLSILIDEKCIIKSGIKETRYVSQKHHTPWLLSSFKMTRLEREKVKPNDLTAVALRDSNYGGDESVKRMKGIITSEDLKSIDYIPPACSTDINNKIKIIIRPWIRIDGSLNRKVLDRFLGTVLSYVISNPGVSLRNIMEKFSPSVTPVWTKDLVEILLEIGCITFSTLIVSEKASLFAKSVIEISNDFTGLEDDDHVIVEAKVDAVTTLGLFIGKKTYSKDFLVD